MFCVFLVIWGVLKYFKFEKESRAFGRTKSHPAVGAWKATIGQESVVEELYCRGHHRQRALRIAPVYKEQPVAQVRRLRDQSNSQRRG